MTGLDRIEAMLRLLQSGKSSSEVQRLLLPESSQRALRACAVTDLVTEDLFESVLRRHAQPGAPELADLADQGLIEAIADEERAWRVPSADAPGWMREWNADQPAAGPAPELIALEADLARWYEQRGDYDEQLRHLLVADPQQALRLFWSMFDDADQRRDFARCQDLLEVLADPNRITLAGPEVSELRLDRAGYLHARLFWSPDYARSAQFLMPPGLQERTDRLLSGTGPQAWQLYAPGGTGKTIQLQWLVARHCVTASMDIPCARIDFDVMDPVNLTRYPWLLLLEVAEQLDRRWPRRVFERLDRYSSYRGLARRMTSELTREAAQGLAGLDVRTHEQAVTEIFIRRLNAAAGERPVLLIVDTVEEAVLGGSDPGGLIRFLGTLLRGCPALRLVLAGRYDLRERMPEAIAELEPVEPVLLTDFAPDQVRTYLASLRGITEPALHDAVLARTDGQPFLVALFADFIDDHQEITPGELLRYREPLVELLIDRIIRHIADPNVQWLVRYGVVPRRLRFDDVRAVIWPMLARGRSGPSDWDDPRADEHHLRGRDDVFPFGSPPQDDAALTETWQRLLAYVARPSWVLSADDGQSVVFHPNVRMPMRDLISRHPAFRDLHEAFRRRFEQLARENLASRAAYLREAVYHRIQLGDPGADDYWRAHVLSCRDHGDLDGMEELASELLRDDYTEDGLPRSRSRGEPMVPYQALADAHVFLAHVAAERARAVQAGPSDPLWSAVQRSLAHADLVRSQAPEPLAAPVLEVALRAALLVAQSRPAEAAAIAEAALPGASDTAQADLLRAVADARAALGDAEAVPSYRAALELADAQERTDLQDAITRSLASQSETQGRLDKAIEWVSRVAKPATDTLVSAWRVWRIVHARLLVECYQPTAALRALADARTSDPTSTVQVAQLRAQAYQLLGRAGHALDTLEAAVGAAEQDTTSGRYAHLAQIHQLRGVMLGEMLAVDRAEDCFQLAAGLWAEIGFSEGHPECSYLYRHFLIRHVGDLAAAHQTSVPVFGTEGDLALRWEEDTAELLTAQGRPARQLNESDVAGLPPRQQARAIAAALARSWSQHRHLLPALTEALGRIKPPSAQLVVLDELRRCEQADPGDIESLRQAFGITVSADDDGTDARLQRGLLAELDRLGGNHVRARRMLNDSAARLPPLPAARLARWRWLQARRRLRVPISKDKVHSLARASASYPLLRAECLHALASAESSPAKSGKLLEQAMSCCQRIDRPTRWAAEIFRAAGQRTGNGSLLATAADLDRQLGRPPQPVLTGSGAASLPVQILADRPGEQAVDLPGPEWAPADLALQRRLVTDWPNLTAEMGRALFSDPAGRRIIVPGLAAARLESDEVAAHALLWELADPPVGLSWPETIYRSLPTAAARIDTRWLQRALVSLGTGIAVDGVLGPATLDALDDYSATGLPVSLDDRSLLERRLSTPAAQTPVAVLLRPEASVESKVPSHSDWGFDVTDLYYQFGFSVRTVQTLLDTPPPTDRDQVAVLHVTGRMDMRGTAPYFDFSPVDMNDRLGFKARGADVRPKDIARWLRGCRPGLEPLVVLDPPYPGSSYDVPWQLVLRNMFAAMLFTEASAPVIIATGVRSSGASYMLPIAQAVRYGGPLAVLVAGLREGPGAGPPGGDWGIADDALAARATAVFAAPSAFTLGDW